MGIKRVVKNIKGTAKVAQNTSAIMKVDDDFDFSTMAKNQMGLNRVDAEKIANGVSLIKAIARGKIDLREPIRNELIRLRQEVELQQEQKKHYISCLEAVESTL